MLRTRSLLHSILTILPLLLAGCGGTGGGNGEFSQEFEKPETTLAPVVDPPDTGDDLSPRERRQMD
ncbi:hypothetical protein [Tautonia marina]|uniref:hypothetical protein n=1 Tax=Tautonia marina TaxID=2653855 RepID=UPI001260F49B|nr:hypothetical protein [Tautonia marina]